MLDSQFDALEEPDDAIVADVSQPPDVMVERILSTLHGPAAAASSTPQKHPE
jgi:gluconate kinase